MSLIETDNGYVDVTKSWLSSDEAAALFEECKQLPFIQNENTLAGRKYLQPRLNYACGDKDVGVHKYSGTFIEVHEWSPGILKVRNRILLETGIYLDSCLLNYYVNGNHYVDYHSDKEVYGPGKPVVTVSLGATRKFKFKSKKGDANKEVDLDSGDCVVMYGDIQDKYTHSIPKETKVKDSRISLTFRLLKPKSLESKGVKMLDNEYSFSHDFKLEIDPRQKRH